MDTSQVRADTARAGEVYCRRVEQFERAGYSGGYAHLLADNDDVDFHLACGLLRSGCSQETAYEILS